ncbi:MAG: hypothetical protein P8R42_20025 [Candidatus Binatia bacterium]|nr:hypothetical protein [Candidatus Binatia bacterium]
MARISIVLFTVVAVVAAEAPAEAKRIAIPRPVVKNTTPSGGGPRAIRPVRPTRPENPGPQNTSGIGHPSFSSPQAQPIVLLPDGSRVYVANTPADTVDVIDTASGSIVTRIDVGIDPVGLAVRPDGKEVWVANHVSDSVSVIDSDSGSATYDQVVATVQAYDMATRSTRFDEPVGIAFASNTKAYVSLSSVNRIAIVDVAGKSVTGHLEIGAQDPRAMVVRGGRLYVVPFESGNQTELAGCLGEDNIDGDQCTFDLLTHVVVVNNVLSQFYDADIVRDPNTPDRDLFVFDTSDDSVVDIVSSVGTLLYGLSVDSEGRVFIAQTEARNDANGRAGTLKHELVDLENRAFLNQIGTVDCTADTCGMPSVFELEPLLPDNPAPGMALATPFGIEISDDDATLVVTAAGSAKIFTMDASSGAVLGRADVGWVPRGVALQSSGSGAAQTAWVLNAVANSVSEVDVSARTQPKVERTIALEDPTHPVVKLGRFAFNNANQSSTETFSCESCHPDGHTDQLLWVLGGPACEIEGCTQIPPRSTMPIRGLRDTAPFHWDGVQGDPFGGRNGQFPRGDVPANCTTQESCALHLLEGALRSTMCDQTNCPNNADGKAGRLSGEERDAMAVFLLSVPPVPARERPIDDQLTDLGMAGFDNFFVNEGRSTCGVTGCHKMPFWTGTNIPGSGMDAPSFRGLPDRWLTLPQGRSNIYELVSALSTEATNEVPWDFDKGYDELSMWALTFGTPTSPAINRNSGGFGPFGVWQMFLEASMGTPGSFGRQVTLNEDSARSSQTSLVLSALETAASDGAILLRGEGVRFGDGGAMQVAVSFEGGAYADRNGDGSSTRDDLLAEAAAGSLVLTLTGRIGPNVTVDQPQPELWSRSDSTRGGKHWLPRLPGDNPMPLFGRHIAPGAAVFIDGRKVAGRVACTGFSQLPNCSNETIRVHVDEHLSEPGLHLVQVQNPGGLQSNEFMFFVD